MIIHGTLRYVLFPFSAQVVEDGFPENPQIPPFDGFTFFAQCQADEELGVGFYFPSQIADVTCIGKYVYDFS